MYDREKILHYAHAAVPRYTSYPTAADFHKLADAPRIAALQKIDANNRISAYIHIPYCDAMCYYCACFTKVTKRKDVIESYVEHLLKDIKLQASYFAGKPKLTHLHWGGGTPSIISREAFHAIMNSLREVFEFDKDTEHAIELDPRYVDEELAQSLAKEGVNRVSLGIQDINETVQKAIGRVQPLETIEKTVKHLRQVGINKINFDLIYGLPYQTQDTLRETCEKLMAFSPDRLACYGYAHLPHRRANQKLINGGILPNSEERFYQAALVGDVLTELGYIPIGIDHFALPNDPLVKASQEGRLHRNFQGYTDDNALTLIGFGASAISEFSNVYAQTIADIGQYKNAIEQGRLGTARGITLEGDDKTRAHLISDLMCHFEVNLASYGGKELFQPELERLQPLLADHIAEQSDETITITEEGKPFVRIVAGLFDAYRHGGKGRFSPAI